MGWEIQLRLADRRAAGLRSLRLRTSSGLGLKYCSPAFSPEPLPSPASVHTTPMPLCSVFSELAELAVPAVPAVGRRLAEAERLLVSPAARRSSWRVCSRAAAGPFLTDSQLCAHVLLTGLLLAASARGPRRSPSRPCWSRPRLARTRQGARPGGRALSVRHLFFLVTNVPALSQLRLSVCPTGSIPVPAWGPHQAFFPLELAWCVSRHRFLFKFKVGPSSTT